MLAKVCSAAVNSIEAYPVEVEVNAGYGGTIIAIIGLISPSHFAVAKPCLGLCLTRSLCWGGANALALGIQERIHRVNSPRPEVSSRISKRPSCRSRSCWLECHTRSRMYLATSSAKRRRTSHGFRTLAHESLTGYVRTALGRPHGSPGVAMTLHTFGEYPRPYRACPIRMTRYQPPPAPTVEPPATVSHMSYPLVLCP